MRIDEVVSWLDNFTKLDAAIQNAVEVLNNRPNRNLSKTEVKNTLLLVGKKMRVDSIKKLFDRFHEKIKKGQVPREYYFYSDVALSTDHPSFAGLREGFSEVSIDSDGFDDEHDTYELANQAEELSRASSVNILRDKELDSVMVDDVTGKVVGGLWASFDGSSFSFDVIVAPKYQNSGIGKRLIQSGMQLFDQYAGMGAELDLHVTNPMLPKLLQRDYNLKIKAKHPDGTVSMGK